MFDTKKFVRILYFETIPSKKWMNKNLKPQEQSRFIRDAVSEKITTIKNKK